MFNCVDLTTGSTYDMSMLCVTLVLTLDYQWCATLKWISVCIVFECESIQFFLEVELKVCSYFVWVRVSGKLNLEWISAIKDYLASSSQVSVRG